MLITISFFASTVSAQSDIPSTSDYQVEATSPDTTQSVSEFSVPYIANYQVEINWHPDATLTITETITVDFGPVLRHGIYRKIPFRYERQIRRFPTTYNLRIRLLSVTDGRGHSYPVKVWKEGSYWFWRIGDPNLYVSGLMVYRITYSVARAINFFPEHDELYWNVTGNEWEWDIARASCVVTFPEEADTSKVRATFYTGYFGSREQNGQMWREGNRWHFTTGYLKKGQGLTIVVGLPKGVVHPPGPGQSAWWFFADNWPYFYAGGLPLFAILIVLRRKWKYRRTPVWRESIVVQYRPPDNLTPAEVGVLLDDQANDIDIVATVIDLAVKGYLKIQEIKSPHLLFRRPIDYEFIILRDDFSGLKEHERIVLEGIVKNPKRFSKLKGHFYPYLEEAKESLYQSLSSKHEGYLAENPIKVKELYDALGVIIVIVTLGLVLWGQGVLFHSAFQTFLLIPSALITLFIFTIFTRIGHVRVPKTAKGAKALWHIAGFREFILRVEKDRLKRMLQEEPNLFDWVLPYALIMGIADNWAEKFEGLLQRPSDWYVSDQETSTTFSSQSFISRLGAGISSMSSTLSCAPSRAGEGGSGFDGDGSSGGGFGGGGGGGW